MSTDFEGPAERLSAETGAERTWSESGGDELPVISVVCPCLNSTSTLAVQLDALAAQETDFPWEMIVVDDGSDDGTPELARSYAGRLPALQVLETPVLRAQAEGMNAGAAVARGRYLVIVDSDDEVAPGYLAAMKAALDIDPVVGARVDDVALNPPFTRVRYEPMQQTGLSVIHGFLPMVIGCTLGIHKELFDKVDGWDVSSTPVIDIDLSWRLQLAGIPLAFAPDAVLRYRYRTGLRSTYRQKRNYAIGDVFVMKRFHAAGAPRRRLTSSIRGWSYVAIHGFKIRDRRSAMLFIDTLGGAVGRLRGSIRYRYLYL